MAIFLTVASFCELFTRSLSNQGIQNMIQTLPFTLLIEAIIKDLVFVVFMFTRCAQWLNFLQCIVARDV